MRWPSFNDLRLFFTYYKSARTRYDVHSPFFHEFIKEVLDTKKEFYVFEDIENIRKKLLRINKKIEFNELGAGSKTGVNAQRNIKDIARHSSTSARDGRLLFNLVILNNASTILELGTSFGIGTSYMAAASDRAHVYTIEGDPASSYMAKRNFDLLGIKNIELYQGPFNSILPDLLKKIPPIDLAYIDGDHTYEGTIKYYNMIKSRLSDKAMIVMDDIYWSKGMYKAWSEIKLDPNVKASIDTHSKGILFFNPTLKIEHKHLTLISTMLKPWRIGLFS